MADNVFSRNSGLKGIVNIELNLVDDLRHGVLIHNNLFEQNTALIESNVLNIRGRNQNAQAFYDPEIMCGGIQLSNNIFKKNAGCRNTYGAVRLSCFDHSLPLNSTRALEINNTIEYKVAIDSQFQVKEMLDVDILDGYIDPEAYDGFKN
jgi:hypothetical protein